MATPTRDRFMDFLRVAGLLIVVAGHWPTVVPYIRRGSELTVPDPAHDTASRPDSRLLRRPGGD